MSRTTLFTAAIVVAVVCLVLAVYYAIPGIYHPLTFSPPNEGHPTHAIAFLALAILGVLVALINRPKSSPRV